MLSPIETSEPVLLAKLSGANGRATLSNLLSPGMRAVTIKTDEIAGVGGFVTPGDRVDIVLTRDAGAIEEVSGNAAGAAGSTITTEIVVENAKVLTVGQGADERQTSPQIVNSVTIEVTVDGAQKIALARNVGTLSLSLRSSNDVAAVKRRGNDDIVLRRIGGGRRCRNGGLADGGDDCRAGGPEIQDGDRDARLAAAIVSGGDAGKARAGGKELN